MYRFRGGNLVVDNNHNRYHTIHQLTPDGVCVEYRGLWQAVLGEFQQTISPAKFNTWLRFTSILGNEHGHLTIAVPNVYTIDYLKRNHEDDITSMLQRVLDEPITRIDYKVTAEAAAAQQQFAKSSRKSPSSKPNQGVTAPLPIKQNQGAGFGNTITMEPRPTTKAATTPKNKLNSKYTFDTFIVGPSNDLAYTMCQTVVKFPGDKFNPLLMYGGVGLGKTHLMQAVGNELLKHNQSLSVQYVTSEQFTNEFLDAISRKKSNFTDKYRSADVLIIDDIQFIAGKERTQEEFFHIFNDLYQSGKQIIMSTDRPPKAIAKLEDRLRSRLESGMTVDIQKPELETRIAIIRTKSEAQGADMPIEVAEYLARHWQHNTRELEGLLTSLIFKCQHAGIELSIPAVSAILGNTLNATTKRRALTPKAIIEQTANYYDVSPADLTGPKRDKDIVVPRQVAMYLMRSELNLSYPKIGAALGGRDHTTAMHSCSKMSKAIENDDALRSEINEIREKALNK